MAVIIRPMKYKDLDRIREVARECWYDAYEGIIPLPAQEMYLSQAYNDEMLMRRISKHTSKVAEVDGEVIGFSDLGPIDDKRTCKMSALYLLPGHQSRGIGKQLFDETLMEEPNAKKIRVYIEEKNTRGQKFYEAQGFEKKEKLQGEFGGYQIPMLIMEKEM
ncbi:Ribosomal protein S18 acetylase RimI [Marinococcus luteus]|uniref:Ribosomal protein S18 acetylase RimI n=1 Tax=Marinococcus luteus TaxID=1122204 RepID=A0A1H2TQB0_9BACI|nr:GNAT family N-acetyltransferase [Marinococcus luteus]SDW46051.1 Ribosomal protein S18 acetylase RimI [Marinococcus luteus]